MTTSARSRIVSARPHRYSASPARFLGGETAGALVPGAPADLVAYRADPFTCPDEQLPDLSPAATVIAGRIAYQGG